ncbi:uncharacterized protein B0T15DRAFT_488046 [Chaetomium strumarium]|uniref:Uncharacterized protein n=1 Tax=Chaetomium strumarium TaxID=1170767 RepID=A0AAJ0H044_9PEZI|nr:hypothetical protein B0T15DRAFT_488046 [Chaetomium strumarium]
MDLHAEYGDNPDDGYDYDLNMFRTEPCREQIEPLLAAFAKEVEEYGPPIRKGHRWGAKSIAARGSKKQKDGDAAAAVPTPPVVQWQVGDWRPGEEVMSLLESLGRQEWLDLEWDSNSSPIQSGG